MDGKRLRYKDWKKRRELYIKEHCELCGSRIVLSLHHKYYDLNKKDEDVFITLCKSCHFLVHFTFRKDGKRKRVPEHKILNRLYRLRMYRDCKKDFGLSQEESEDYQNLVSLDYT